MAEEPKPKRVIHPDDPDLTELEQALGYAIGAVVVSCRHFADDAGPFTGPPSRNIDARTSNRCRRDR